MFIYAKMKQEERFEIIEPMEDNGITYNVPTSCDFNTLVYLSKNSPELIVNCKPVNEVIANAVDGRIEKSDSIRRLFNY